MTTPKWIDLKISMGNILSILTIIFGLTAGWFTLSANVSTNAKDIVLMDKRLAKTEVGLEQIADSIGVDRLSISNSLTQLQSDVRYMRDSIDELKRRAN